MRKVILLVMVTLDGFFDGPGEGLEKIDWHHADEEWEDYSVEILSGAEANLESLEQIAHTLPAQRYAMPDEIAAAALYLGSNEAGFVHGITLPVDGGYLAT